MRPAFSYILYTKSSHEQIDDIITFSQFEEGALVENECDEEEDESILASIYGLSTDKNSDDGYISTNTLRDTRSGIQIYPEINAGYARFKICDHNIITKNE